MRTWSWWGRSLKRQLRLSGYQFYPSSFTGGPTDFNASVCLSVCLSRLNGLYLKNHWTDFLDLLHTYWKLGPIECIKFSESRDEKKVTFLGPEREHSPPISNVSGTARCRVFLHPRRHQRFCHAVKALINYIKLMWSSDPTKKYTLPLKKSSLESKLKFTDLGCAHRTEQRKISRMT